MSQTDANGATCRCRNHLESVFQFRSYGQYPNASACRLPKAFEQRQRRNQQILWRVNTATQMADERALKMDACGQSATFAAAILFALEQSPPTT